MFGFVVLSKENSSEKDREIYKSHYCGLCHVLNEKYGKKGTMALSYDMVFLEMLLSDLHDERRTEGMERCNLHPVKSHPYVYTRASKYAADMQMLLYYHALLDNVHDEGKDRRKAEKYKEFIEKLEQDYPRQCKAVSEGLSEIISREESNEKDISLMALLFGRILGEIFVQDDEDFFASELRLIGCGLGRFIYILDAYSDRVKDQKKGLYNPLGQEMSNDEVKELLLDAASIASAAFERLPLDEYIPILRNILYSGIWTKFKAEDKK